MSGLTFRFSTDQSLLLMVRPITLSAAATFASRGIGDGNDHAVMAVPRKAFAWSCSSSLGENVPSPVGTRTARWMANSS
jgi:hypothetical protein